MSIPVLPKSTDDSAKSQKRPANSSSAGIIFVVFSNNTHAAHFAPICNTSACTVGEKSLGGAVRIRDIFHKRKDSVIMKATGIVRRIDDLGRVVIPKEIRRTMRIREGDPMLTTLTPENRFIFAMLELSKRIGANC